MYYLVAPLIIARGESAAFTYDFDQKLSIGTLVVIPLGKKRVNGLVIASSKKPGFATKSILEITEVIPMPEPLVKTALWLSEYYATHLALVLQTLLPSGLTKKRRGNYENPQFSSRKRTKIVFNKDQQNAIKLITNTGSGSVLLHGVTGSGKTQVYIESARSVLAKNKSVIMLVPEIALTSQLLAELAYDFGKQLVVTHSGLTEAQRHLIWHHCLTSPQPLVVVGPRSALFSPVKNLGLIVIDECHEPSYKQEQAPRYSALRAASVLSHNAGATLVLGSATPSIVDHYLAQQAKAGIIMLKNPARPNVQKPTVTLVKLTDTSSFGRHRFLSNQLLGSIERNLTDGLQTLLFHNRRGSAPITICSNCSWTAACPRCFNPLVLHTDAHLLRCHACGYHQAVPKQCPVCDQPDIVHRGIGTKLIIEELTRLFPKARLARFDSDSQSAERLHEQYQALYDGKIDLIVGTQTVAKGLDLPRLRTVGVIQADSGLNLPDYQAEERVFQLIHQVVGRVGRDAHATDVIVQSYQPDHPSIRLGVAQDYEGFYNYAITKRRHDQFPPYRYLLKLTCIYKSEAAAVRASKQLREELAKKHKTVQIFGPAPAFYERLNDTYRWQLLIKSTSRAALLAIAKDTPATHWQVDIDPASLL